MSQNFYKDYQVKFVVLAMDNDYICDYDEANDILKNKIYNGIFRDEEFEGHSFFVFEKSDVKINTKYGSNTLNHVLKQTIKRFPPKFVCEGNRSDMTWWDKVCFLRLSFDIFGWKMFDHLYSLELNFGENMVQIFYNACLYRNNGKKYSHTPTIQMISINEKKFLERRKRWL